MTSDKSTLWLRLNITKGQGLSLGLSLAVPLYYALVTLHYAFDPIPIIQDDARQHVVWLQRLVDPTMFPSDPIADYFLTVAPVGYKAVYGLAAAVSIEPLQLAKLLPLPLALVTTVYLFQLTLLIVPSSLSALFATVVLNQHLWLNDDLVSATPRAFVYPLFSAFLYYLARRSPLPCLVSMALLGVFFPQLLLLAVTILTVALVDWRDNSVRITHEPGMLRFWLLGVGVAIAVLLPFALNLSDYGPAVTATEMRTLPEYGPGGRSEYFGVGWWNFVLNGASGLRIPVFPSIIWVGFGLPFLKRGRSPLASSITPRVEILVHVVVASLGLFLLAHLLLLRLHFPSRYTYHSFRFVLAIAAGIVLADWAQRRWRWWQGRRQTRASLTQRQTIALALIGLVAAIVVVVPAVPGLMVKFQGWIRGEMPTLYAYLANQPKDTMVASLAAEANNIPAFAQRSTWVGREFALAHHPQYYAVVRDRAAALVHAQYSESQDDLRQFLDAGDIDFVLLERSAFEPEYLMQDWLIQSSIRSVVEEAIATLTEGKEVAIAPLMDQCAVVSTETLVLLDATCLMQPF